MSNRSNIWLKLKNVKFSNVPKYIFADEVIFQSWYWESFNRFSLNLLQLFKSTFSESLSSDSYGNYFKCHFQLHRVEVTFRNGHLTNLLLVRGWVLKKNIGRSCFFPCYHVTCSCSSIKKNQDTISSMLMILLSILSVIRHLSCGNN